MHGLSQHEVAKKTASGDTNRMPEIDGRTGFDILKAHLLTYFNCLNLIIFLLVLVTGSYTNTLFMGVAVTNAMIGICQEFYLKKKLQGLKEVRKRYYTVIREESRQTVSSEELVKEDLVCLSAGEQVPCDMEVVFTEYLEVNEALITGESDSVVKQTGDTLVSGSFLVSGECRAKAIRVGEETYYAQLISHAGKYRRMPSEILDGIQKIIQLMSFVILPLGVILFLSTFYRDGADWRIAVITTAAGVVGMIPSGLYLITTVTAGTAVLKLAKKKAVVSDFTAVERLSRVTTVCLDKTGTLTTGEMKVKRLISYDTASREILKLFCKAFPVKNATLEGIFRECGANTPLEWESLLPFSSERKYSELISDGVCYRLGAAEQLITNEKLLQTVNEFVAQGERVLALCKEAECMALVIMEDVLKPNAEAMLDYFRVEKIGLKIISGDHPETVAAIAKKLGFRDSDQFVDLQKQTRTLEHYRKLVKLYSVFGRVTPEEKKLLVQALRENGEVVAMSGDGVNDVLALKEADLAIAMANGAQAAKSVSQIVLTESDFTPMPDILKEGRRIVNNIERVAGLYLVKTGYSLFLTVFFILFGMNYPFAPISMTVIGGLSIGIPSFFLALEANDKPVEKEFLPSVFRSALPTAVLISLFVGFFGILEMVGYLSVRETLSFYLTAYFSFFQLVRCSQPFTVWKMGVISVVLVCFFICLFVPGLLPLASLAFSDFILLGACLLLGSFLLMLCHPEE